MSNPDVKITAQLRHPCGLAIDITGTPEDIQNAAARLNEMAAALAASGGKVAPAPPAPTLSWPYVIGGQYIAGCQYCAQGMCFLHGKFNNWPNWPLGGLAATNISNCPVCGKLGCTEMHVTCVNNPALSPVGQVQTNGTIQAFIGMLGGGDAQPPQARGMNSSATGSTSVH